jgi:hypothetical protein
MSDSSEKRDMIRRIATEERFVYEIMLACLVITLTSLQQLRKIGAFKNKKKSG